MAAYNSKPHTQDTIDDGHKKTPGKLICSSIKSVKTVRASSMQVRISDFTFVDTDDVV